MTEVCTSPAHQNMPSSSPIGGPSSSKLQSQCRQQESSSNPGRSADQADNTRTYRPMFGRRNKRRASHMDQGGYGQRAKQGRRDYRASSSQQKSEPLPFLLGGNKKDPLNLGNIGNEVTPKNSPPQQVEIVVPKDPTDPLNLKGRQHRKRKRRDSLKVDAGCSEDNPRPGSPRNVSLSDSELPHQKQTKISSLGGPSSAKKEKTQSSSKILSSHAPKDGRPKTLSFSMDGRHRPPPRDKIVSPVFLPSHQHRGRRPHPHHHGRKSVSPPKKVARVSSAKTSQKPPDRFRYGNYDRYYGKRLDDKDEDVRYECFSKDWIQNKKVLDIGCNVGFLTLKLAKDMGPKWILGIDIDEYLVRVANRNTRQYVDRQQESNWKYPSSFERRYGSLSVPSTSEDALAKHQFPENVSFRHENYVLDSDEKLEKVEPEFDTILALSITKWIHLNWGDEGLKRFFARVYRHLRPGGHFVLEPQEFDTYAKKSKLTADMKEHYRNIALKPDQFSDYLVETLGFEKPQIKRVDNAISKGFKRPILVFKKPGGGTQSGSEKVTTLDCETEKKTTIVKKETSSDKTY